MSYKQAAHILPPELLREVQAYIDGECIYIPRLAGRRRNWGEGTAIRRELKARNERIFADFTGGEVSIGRMAFSSCEALNCITLANGVADIGEGAFSNCGLNSVTIPGSVTDMGIYAFSGVVDILRGLDAKKNGQKYYDFWGITTSKDKNHPWYGFTQYKKSFGGRQVDYAGTYDLPINRKKYALYSLLRPINKLKRKITRK